MTLTLEGVGKTVHGETHVAGMDLTLEPGRFYVLLGPTLAGKTTLMRLMAGLDRPTAGRVRVDGQDVTGVPVRKRNVAMVYQQFVNYPSFTVYENIASPLRRAGKPKAEIDAAVREAAAALKLDNLLDRLPGQLSGGQQQRTALARALVKEADLLLLDEPLVNLDYKLREELRVELRQIFARRRAIVVYATTEPAEALMMGGDTLVLHEGRVLQHGPTHQVYHHPASATVGRTFSDPPMNFVAGEVADGRARLGERIALPLSGHLAQLRPGRYQFGVRAGHLTVARRHDDDVAFAARVELAEISGSETFVHVDLGGGASWVVQEDGVHSLDLGEEIAAYIDPRHVYAFDLDGRLVASPSRQRGPAVAVE